MSIAVVLDKVVLVELLVVENETGFSPDIGEFENGAGAEEEGSTVVVYSMPLAVVLDEDSVTVALAESMVGSFENEVSFPDIGEFDDKRCAMEDASIEAVISSSFQKDVDELVSSLFVVLDESIINDENVTGFSPGLDELDGDAISKLDVIVEAGVSSSMPKDVDKLV